MTAIILSIGDELVLGQTVDTNSAWISAKLAAVGCGVLAHVTVSDDQPAIQRAIAGAAGECDWLIISGGIGPTEDDLTRQALAEVLNQPLELYEPWLKRLQDFFQKRGRPMPQSNRIQAMIPRGARAMHNTAGTAAGIDAVIPPAAAGLLPTRVFVMPGVPKEMKIMFEQEALPAIAQAGGGAVILSRTLHTFGLGESTVAEQVGDLMKRGRNPSVGTTVANGVVSLRVNARFPSLVEAAAQLDQTVSACRGALKELIYGEDEQTLAQVVAGLLAPQGQPVRTVATAESCTGGLLAKMLTDVSGSSRYFGRGWITYSNDAKQELLGVPAAVLQEHGAVSEPVVQAMARSAQQQARADFGLSISGIAGPDGGTESKPVGTVCIALADAAGEIARTFLFPGDREFIRDRSAKMALSLLRYRLLEKPPPF